ncbi:FecR family protein [Bacteroides sp. GM023]|uniref:FecR family protein n=1 Tax=Bacteroides sp. GM023 TaxID=2723058 RepID=UPI00168BE737|nr:FecR family protein [Bacteroides sp. GM023]MBD3588525.1 DUF4974 domain-containing protein [Bacteroides sp. GM023]
MNKDIDNINNADDSVKKALDLMESRAELSDEQLREMLEDEECLQACRDIMDSSLFLQQKSGTKLPNVEAELEWFKKKQHSLRMRSNLWKTGIGIAAMIAILFGAYYFINTLTTPPIEPITVFTADATPQHIVLQKDNGEKIVLDEPKANNQTLPKTVISTSEKKELDYRQVISTTTQTHILTVPRGESFKVVLCDGTEVWLNANTNFVYPTVFVGNERVVTLEGEAYFKVTKDSKHPFIVKTPNVQTRVLGTEFNIRSYTPEDTHVVLINGKVEVSNAEGGSFTRLYPGEDAHLQSDGNFLLTEVDLDSYVYWKDGYFYFDDVTLKDIMQNLGRWYNVNIEFRNKEAMDYKMHFVSDRTKDLEHTISLLNRMKKVTVTLQGNTLTID